MHWSDLINDLFPIFWIDRPLALRRSELACHYPSVCAPEVRDAIRYPRGMWRRNFESTAFVISSFAKFRTYHEK